MNALSSTSSGQHVKELYLEPSERPGQVPSPTIQARRNDRWPHPGSSTNTACPVTWPGFRDDSPHPSQTVTPLSVKDIGRDVVLAFVTVDLVQQPMIMGLIQKPTPLPATKTAPAQGLEVITDGKRMILTAQEEITLRCGKASITMTKAGKSSSKATTSSAVPEAPTASKAVRYRSTKP